MSYHLNFLNADIKGAEDAHTTIPLAELLHY
jgi:hypothetical protein